MQVRDLPHILIGPTDIGLSVNTKFRNNFSYLVQIQDPRKRQTSLVNNLSNFARVAQWLVQGICNAKVGGSNPSMGSTNPAEKSHRRFESCLQLFRYYKESQMEPKEIIRLQIRTNREYLSDIRKSQEEDLYKLCESLGGHQWWDWQERWEENVLKERRKIKSRQCEWCLKEERKVLTDWE